MDSYTSVTMGGAEKLTLGGGGLASEPKDLKLYKDFIERLVLLKDCKH